MERPLPGLLPDIFKLWLTDLPYSGLISQAEALTLNPPPCPKLGIFYLYLATKFNYLRRQNLHRAIHPEERNKGTGRKDGPSKGHGR